MGFIDIGHEVQICCLDWIRIGVFKSGHFTLKLLLESPSWHVLNCIYIFMFNRCYRAKIIIIDQCLFKLYFLLIFFLYNLKISIEYWLLRLRVYRLLR